MGKRIVRMDLAMVRAVHETYIYHGGGGGSACCRLL